MVDAKADAMVDELRKSEMFRPISATAQYPLRVQ